MKNFFRRFGSGVLKTVEVAGAAAPAAVALAVPGSSVIGAVAAITEAVVDAQRKHGTNADSAPAKLADVQATYKPIVNILGAVVEAQTGRDIDEDRLVTGLGQIMEGILNVLKALGTVPVRPTVNTTAVEVK